MNLYLALSIIALAASVILLFSAQARVPAAVAVGATGVEVLLAFHIVHLSIWRVPVNLILGAALLAAAAVIYFKSVNKPAVTAATVAVLVGAVQVLRGLKVL